MDARSDRHEGACDRAVVTSLQGLTDEQRLLLTIAKRAVYAASTDCFRTQFLTGGDPPIVRMIETMSETERDVAVGTAHIEDFLQAGIVGLQRVPCNDDYAAVRDQVLTLILLRADVLPLGPAHVSGLSWTRAELRIGGQDSTAEETSYAGLTAAAARVHVSDERYAVVTLGASAPEELVSIDDAC